MSRCLLQSHGLHSAHWSKPCLASSSASLHGKRYRRGVVEVACTSVLQETPSALTASNFALRQDEEEFESLLQQPVSLPRNDKWADTFVNALRDYRALQQELRPWLTAFEDRHGRKPNHTDISEAERATENSNLRELLQRFLLIRQKLFSEIPHIRHVYKAASATPSARHGKGARRSGAPRVSEGASKVASQVSKVLEYKLKKAEGKQLQAAANQLHKLCEQPVAAATPSAAPEQLKPSEQPVAPISQLQQGTQPSLTIKALDTSHMLPLAPAPSKDATAQQAAPVNSQRANAGPADAEGRVKSALLKALEYKKKKTTTGASPAAPQTAVPASSASPHRPPATPKVEFGRFPQNEARRIRSFDDPPSLPSPIMPLSVAVAAASTSVPGSSNQVVAAAAAAAAPTTGVLPGQVLGPPQPPSPATDLAIVTPTATAGDSTTQLSTQLPAKAQTGGEAVTSAPATETKSKPPSILMVEPVGPASPVRLLDAAMAFASSTSSSQGPAAFKRSGPLPIQASPPPMLPASNPSTSQIAAPFKRNVPLPFETNAGSSPVSAVSGNSSADATQLAGHIAAQAELVASRSPQPLSVGPSAAPSSIASISPTAAANSLRSMLAVAGGERKQGGRSGDGKAPVAPEQDDLGSCAAHLSPA